MKTKKLITLANFERLAINLELKPQDCWIGVFWKKELYLLHIWICIIPVLPIHIMLFKSNWHG